MGFEHPWLLLLGLFILLLAFVLRHGSAGTRETLRELGSCPPPRGYFVFRYSAAAVFIGLLVIVAAKPYVEPRATGDYLFLVDTSRSMEARNSCGGKTFLERSKDVIRTVMHGVPEARFGIVAFDRLAFPITQLTYDHSYLQEVVNSGLFIGMSYRATGTRLGNALSVVARKKQGVEELFGRVQYVILLTDGHMGTREWRPDLEQPIKELQDAGIRILAVGIGNETETAIPITTPGGDCSGRLFKMNGRIVRIPLRSDILKYIAAETEGRYFDEGGTDQLVTFLREETLTDVPEGAEFTSIQRKDIGWVFLVPATIALFGFLLL